LRIAALTDGKSSHRYQSKLEQRTGELGMLGLAMNVVAI
jgi:hypothetical protein